MATRFSRTEYHGSPRFFISWHKNFIYRVVLVILRYYMYTIQRKEVNPYENNSNRWRTRLLGRLK